MSFRHNETHDLDQHPRNTPSSSTPLQFWPREPRQFQPCLDQCTRFKVQSQTIIDYFSRREQTSSLDAFTFTGDNLSTLGDSTLFLSSPPAHDYSYQRAGSPNITFSHRAISLSQGFTSLSAPPEVSQSSPLFKQGLERPISSKNSEVMVVEREAPKEPYSHSKPNQHGLPKGVQPEFGKASTLQSPLRNSIFNIPKPGRPRPEHHTTIIPSVESTTQVRRDAKQEFRIPLQSYDPVKLQPAVEKVEDEDVVEIARPTNDIRWSHYPPNRPPTYSSLINSKGDVVTVPKAQYDPLRRFPDLTDTALFMNKFGDPDPLDYVDAEKATKNIKALLTGAFEDEEDKPKTRGAKRKLRVDAAEIANRLQGLKIGSKTNGDVTRLEEEEEEEEEEDDGSIEGLKVKLLPHQVDGVTWMRDKENGLIKKNGVLPKGGILADDVSPIILAFNFRADASIDGTRKDHPIYCSTAYKSSTTSFQCSHR